MSSLDTARPFLKTTGSSILSLLREAFPHVNRLMHLYKNGLPKTDKNGRDDILELNVNSESLGHGERIGVKDPAEALTKNDDVQAPSVGLMVGDADRVGAFGDLAEKKTTSQTRVFSKLIS